jgi:hypothetical protein
MIKPFFGHGQANQASTVPGHEVNGFGRDFSSGQREVTLILAVLVVHYDDHAPSAKLFDRGRYVREWIKRRHG